MIRYQQSATLPLFEIRSSQMDVPVHRNHKHEPHNVPRKTFGATFHSRKYKHKSSSHADAVVAKSSGFYEVDSKADDISANVPEPKPKISRKKLMKDYEHVVAENFKLVERANALEQSLNKKEAQVTKLKENLVEIQNFNANIVDENNAIKTEYQDLLGHFEECKMELEKKTCPTCNELSKLLEKSQSEYIKLGNTNKQLSEDLNMLKNVVYRLNVQLERYQEKLRNIPHLQSDALVVRATLESREEIGLPEITSEHLPQHSGHSHTPISWGNVNSHTLGPLLDAYQDTVAEKEGIIRSYENELCKFTGKLKEIINENENLHKLNIDVSEKLAKFGSEVEACRNELKVTKEQNDLLIKKCSLKQDQLQEVIETYEYKVESLNREYSVLHEKYHNTRGELLSAQGKYESLVQATNNFKSNTAEQIPLSTHTASVNECKRLFEELKLQYECEKVKMGNQIKILEQQLPDLEKQVIALGADKRELQIRTKGLEKQLKKMEQKYNETYSSLTHTQISRDACKRQLGKAMSFAKELVTEQESLLKQLSAKQHENRVTRKMGEEIAVKMDSLKSQLKTVQKDAIQELVTVEQRLQEQDQSMESLRLKRDEEIARLLREIQKRDDTISRLKDQLSLPLTPGLLYRERNLRVT